LGILDNLGGFCHLDASCAVTPAVTTAP
jgi:hypothetical protein